MKITTLILIIAICLVFKFVVFPRIDAEQQRIYQDYQSKGYGEGYSACIEQYKIKLK